MHIAQHTVRVGASVGISHTDGADAGEILRTADVALYEVKADGKTTRSFLAEAPQDR